MRAGPSALALCLTIVAACGGGEPAGPTPSPDPIPPAYPNVAGAYNFTAYFDQLTYAQAHLSGVITLVQPSRDVRALNGDFDFILTVDGQPKHWAVTFDSAWVSTRGVMAFWVTNGPETWMFTGTLAANTITGRHTLTDGVTPISGGWSGTRSTPATAQVARAAPALPGAAEAGLEGLAPASAEHQLGAVREDHGAIAARQWAHFPNPVEAHDR